LWHLDAAAVLYSIFLPIMQLSHYRQGQAKKALIFLHAANDHSSSWHRQVNDPLFKDYSRICIDLPGHGGSPVTEDYSLPALGKIIAAHIKSLDLEEYTIVTASLGGNIAAEALPFLPGCRGLFMTGACVVGGMVAPAAFMKPFQYGSVLFESNPDETRLEGYLKGLIMQQDEAVLDRMTRAFRQTDPAFRAGLAASLTAGNWSDQITCLKEAAVPLAFLFGENEQIIDCAYLQQQEFSMWGNAIHQFKDAGHLAHLDQPYVFNKMLADFVNDVG
jgi:pimeloyl-ACP methyl ester carboxylesterase